ncbi:hypothetical protein ACKWRH_31160 [Bradyrhizobium sp. Pa8]|uniref:hypothetical protein n=1 Tax=Bradyrhizobium sp. Pa8 TaxID=3386552 RepID=UPI00403FB5DE
MSRGTPCAIVEQAERILRKAVTLLRGAALSHRRFGTILRHVASGLEHEARMELHGGIAPVQPAE